MKRVQGEFLHLSFFFSITGPPEAHALRPPGPSAVAGRTAHLAELPVQHQRGDHPTQTVHDGEEGRGQCGKPSRFAASLVLPGFHFGALVPFAKDNFQRLERRGGPGARPGTTVVTPCAAPAFI